MTNSDIDLITMRQYLFLHWLFERKVKKKFCNLENTDIECKNCLDRNKDCELGLIPASYFYKKIGRQYYDCKRVLDKMEEEEDLITRIEIEGNGYTVFYQITDKGCAYYKRYCKHFAL